MDMSVMYENLCVIFVKCLQRVEDDIRLFGIKVLSYCIGVENYIKMFWYISQCF